MGHISQNQIRSCQYLVLFVLLDYPKSEHAGSCNLSVLKHTWVLHSMA